MNDSPQPAQSRAEGAAASALATFVSGSAAPYGYTVSLWSSGALLMHFRSPPGVGEVFLFATGALCGFGLVGLIAQPALRAKDPPGPGRPSVLAGMLHWFAVGVSVGTVALVAEIHSELAWPLGSFLATTLYLLCASLQLAAIARWRESG